MPSWWDRFIIAVTILSLGVVIYDESAHATPYIHSIVTRLDLTFCSLLLIDFFWRLSRARQQLGFVSRNWPDFIAALPIVSLFRHGGLLRFVRLVRILRFIVLARKLLRQVQWPQPSAALGYLATVTVGFWAASSMLFYAFEHRRNEHVHTPGDALWWCVTTLSTVGYGDIYPVTTGGRIIAGVTMASGVGLLGLFAATVATMFVELREQGRRGLRSVRLKNHLLVLGWNEKAAQAIEEFRLDDRFRESPVVIVADIEQSPLEYPWVRFVKGPPGRKSVLEKASASDALFAIVVATNSNDPRSDHETALTAAALRKLCPNVRISAELISSSNREYLEDAGCDVIVDPLSLASRLLARGVSDNGIGEVVDDLISSKDGVQIFRCSVGGTFPGKTYREAVIQLLAQNYTLIGLFRDGKHLLKPQPDLVLTTTDELYIIAEYPPIL